MRSSSIRTTLALLLVSLGAGCDTDTPTDGPTTLRPPTRRRANETNAAGPYPGDSVTGAPIDMKGTVVDDGLRPIAGCPVLVVDAKGKKVEATTDNDGVFIANGVAAPYDLKVASPSALSDGHAQILLGLTRSDVRLLHRASDPTTWMDRRGKVLASVAYPACPSGCYVQVRTASSRGHGAYLEWTSGPAHTARVAVDHDWKAPVSAPSDENVSVDVLISDEDFATFWHSRIEPWTLQPDGALDLGTIVPQPIARFGPVTIRVNAHDVPIDWRKEIQVFLAVPGHTPAFYLQGASSNSLVTFLPSIPGATFEVSARQRAEHLTDPTTGDRLLSQSAHARVASLPLSTIKVTLEVHKGPSVLRPEAMGLLSRASAGFAWEPTPGRIGQLGIDDAAEQRPLAIISTAANEVPLERLEALGIALRDGRYTLSLVTQVAASLDAWAESAASTGPSDGTSSTVIEFAFDVVP